MMLRALLFLMVIAVVGDGWLGRVSPASAEIEIRSNAAQNQFPDGIRFSLFLASDEEIADVRLRYRILPGGVNATVRPDCTTGTVCNAIVGSTRDSYMVPGAEVVYYWEVEDASGEMVLTDEQTVQYEDTRFEWQSISEGNLTVYYYFGDAEAQRTVLRVAQETIERFSELLNTTIDFPVKIWVYQTAADMAPAVASRRGAGPDDSVRTLGEVGAADTALVSRDTDFLNIVRHELAHVVTGAATEDHIAELPTWINEGLSTYAQRELLPSEAQALELAIRRNQVLPITSLGSSARGTASEVSIFYAQSGSLVAFLIDTYGDEAFGEFIDALKNDTTSGALESVYGFDQLGLENEWRKAVGLPEVEVGGGGQDSSAVPTREPFGTDSQAPSSEQQPEDSGEEEASAAAEDSDGGSTDAIAIVIAVLAVVTLAAGGFYVQSTRRGAG